MLTAADVAPFVLLALISVAAIAYKAGQHRERMRIAALLIAAKHEAYERGKAQNQLS